jgi:hypothetical protein
MDRRRVGQVGRRSLVLRVIGLALLLTLGWLVPLSGPGNARAATSATPAPCHATDLAAAITHQGVTDTTLIHVGVTTIGADTECTLMGQPQVQLRDAQGNLLVASPAPDPSAGSPVALSAGVGAGASFQWSNWCGSQGTTGTPPPLDGPITVIVVLPGDAGQLVAHPRGTEAEEGPLDGGPPCLSSDKPSELIPVKPFEAAPGAALGPPGGPSFYVSAPFLDYWRTHGGLAIFGYPLSREIEVKLEDGKTYTVQYFERARFEYHPENAAPDNVLLGQLGRAAHPVDPPATPLPAAVYFPETGHNLHTGFRDYWEAHGGLAQFGYPLTEEGVEISATDGKPYTVQYFERARFEWHPENAGTPYEVLLGQLGRQVYTAGAEPAPPQTPASGYCSMAVGAAATVRVNSDTPSPRCQRVQPGQHLLIVNKTDRPVRARLAQFDVTIPPQGEQAIDQPFGTYLAPGVHTLALSAYAGGGAELWLQP